MTPDTTNDSTRQDRNEGGYPRRPAFWAHRVIRMMNKACAANDIGPDGFTLVATIAMTEDAKRYQSAVTFYNGQLMPITGLRSEARLDRTRKKCVEAGWLSYEPGTKSTPGRYWTLIPATAEQFTDTPVDDGPTEASEIVGDHFPETFPPDSTHETRGNPIRMREECAKNPKCKQRPSIPNPIPCSLSKHKGSNLPAKIGRSPPAVAECVPLEATAKQRSKRPPFQKPTVSEVTQYVLEIGATVDARQFCDYYESNGWLVGRAAMRDWKATVRNWESRRLEGKHYARSKSPTREHAREQANADSWDILEAVARSATSDVASSGQSARITEASIDQTSGS